MVGSKKILNGPTMTKIMNLLQVKAYKTFQKKSLHRSSLPSRIIIINQERTATTPRKKQRFSQNKRMQSKN